MRDTIQTRRARSRVGWILPSLIAVFVVAACGGPTTTPSTPTAPASSSNPGSTASIEPTGPSGDVIIAYAAEHVSMDAWRAFSRSTGAPGFQNAVEALVYRDLASGDVLPLLATAWEAQGTGAIRFTLREGVKFHDGSAFNAEAAARSINHTYDPDNAFDILDFTGPMQAQAVDEFTLEVTTPEPDPLLLQKLAWVSISSAQQLDQDPASYSNELIGTGPYVFEEWRRGESISYTANPEWWGIDNPEAIGEQTIARGVYLFRSEDLVRSSMVGTGEAHVAQFVTPEECANLESAPETRCEGGPSVETMFIRMDTNSPLLSDVRAREALQLAIDKEAIVTQILGGSGTVTGQIVNESATGHNAELEPYPFDPERARSLLAEAGGDGVPVDLEIQLVARQGVVARIDEVIEAVAEMLRDVGFTVTTSLYDPEAFGELFLVNIKDVPPTRNLVGIHLHGNEILDFATSYNFYYSCDGILSTYCNEEADAVWNEALTQTGTERDETLQRLNALAYDDVAMGYIAHLDLQYGVREELEWQVKLDHSLLLTEMRLAN